MTDTKCQLELEIARHNHSGLRSNLYHLVCNNIYKCQCMIWELDILKLQVCFMRGGNLSVSLGAICYSIKSHYEQLPLVLHHKALSFRYGRQK